MNAIEIIGIIIIALACAAIVGFFMCGGYIGGKKFAHTGAYSRGDAH